MDLTKNQILNSFEVETIFNKLLDNEISIEGMHDTIKAQIIAFVNKKKEAKIHGLYETLKAGAINENMIGGDVNQYISKHTIREQKIIDFLSIDNSLKESFSSQKIEGFVKNELAKLNGHESAKQKLNTWKSKLEKINDKSFEYESILNIYQSIKSHANLFWQQGQRNEIESWLNDNSKGMNPIKFSINWNDSTPAQPNNKLKKKLTIEQIALKFAYEGVQVTRENAGEIIKEYGHNSGEKLYQRNTYYLSAANRKARPTPCTPKKLDNKIKLIESIIELLPSDQQERAKDEVSILKTIYNTEYQ